MATGAVLPVARVATRGERLVAVATGALLPAAVANGAMLLAVVMPIRGERLEADQQLEVETMK